MFKDIIKRYPRLAFLADREFELLPEENQLYLKELIEDALFWVELEERSHPNDGFKFLAASYGLAQAEGEARQKGLQGKEREKFIRPHQDLYTMFNPYSGTGNEKK